MVAFVAPQVQAALVALLAARPGLADVQVSDGFSGEDETQPERVFTNDARGTQVASGLKAGRTFYQESAEFDVIAQVLGIDQTPAQTKARVQELAVEVAECVADNRTLGSLAGLNFAVVDRWELSTMYGQTGSVAEITLTVRYQARLT